jgi:hypothetical protein
MSGVRMQVLKNKGLGKCFAIPVGGQRRRQRRRMNEPKNETNFYLNKLKRAAENRTNPSTASAAGGRDAKSAEKSMQAGENRPSKENSHPINQIRIFGNHHPEPDDVAQALAIIARLSTAGVPRATTS